jgi:hypothetical protein
MNWLYKRLRRIVIVPQACRWEAGKYGEQVCCQGTSRFASRMAAQLGNRYRHDVWNCRKDWVIIPTRNASSGLTATETAVALHVLDQTAGPRQAAMLQATAIIEKAAGVLLTEGKAAEQASL